MKLLRYGPSGSERPGLLDGAGRVRDLSGHIDDIAGQVLTPEGLARLAALDPETLPLVEGIPQQDLRLGPCIGQVGKFIAIGLNYACHASEAGMELPAEPVIFTKWTSSIAGPDDPLHLPAGSAATDWEVELGIVIGSTARNLSESEAMAHVAGYCVVNDISERDWQLRRGGTWDKGKGHDGFGPLGPWLVTKDEIADPAALRLWLEVDGERMQDGSTAQMVFGVARLVAECSRYGTLHPGDVITTGTPAGVGMGMKPPRYLRAGQQMRLGIDGLGVQNQQVIAG
ncbi:fumarylacetoacetate hydrolase family protein [Paracoccus siganidrum]|uniref:FAA hydrolase family protein n=1 Tax=Paracoccus siganidrum TaxID=1276757 RepID=A0A419A529_9RHOB|nr:fumarylacetoacetate hydrolase family protein [Paracoccus siganidrum]RJL10884.1 FAA hydrolase family protein [Paracoccus siganidrum]RMC28937.1 ureidoglycolate lyase [Paracoccus siganidrum]